MNHDELADWDAAYVLGALSPADRREFERHLAGCDRCTAAVAEIAGLPPLLGSVPVAHVVDAAPVEPVPGTLLPRMVREVRRRSRRRRVLVAGAGLVAAAAVGVAVLVVVRPTGAPAVAEQPLVAVVPSRLDAEVQLVDESWGTRIELRCSYAAGADDSTAPPPTDPRQYVMVVTDAADHTSQVASWTAGPGSTVEPTGSTSLTRAEITSLEVRSTSGVVLLRLQR